MLLGSIVATAAALMAASPALAQSSDPCTVINGAGTVIPLGTVQKCYASFPLDPTAKAAQINTLLGLAEIYPSTTAAKKLVDLPAELNAIGSASITSEFEFQSRITKVINKLQDGHFAYAATCFSVIQFFQPWVIAAKYDSSGKPTLYLNDVITKGTTISVDFYKLSPSLAGTWSSNALNAWTTDLGTDPSLLVGSTITAIDDQDPIAAVQSFVDDYVGTSHTAETRFNYGLAATVYTKKNLRIKDGAFVSTMGAFDLPATRKYTLRTTDGQTVTVTAPWYGLFPSTKSVSITASRFYSTFCDAGVAAKAASLMKTTSVSNMNAVNLMAHLNDYDIDVEALEALRAKSKAVVKTNPPSLLLGDDFDGFYYMSDTKTGVFTIPGFAPEGVQLTETVLIGWLTTWAKGLAALESAGAVNLIIDTTNNGGGIICSGKSLLTYLFKDSKFVQYDVRLTKTVNYLLDNASKYRNETNSFDFSTSIIPDGKSTTSSDSKSILQSAARSRTRNGVQDSYSGLFDIDCQSLQNVFLGIDTSAGKFPQITGWNPANVAVVSNGLCGSTCAESVRSLRSQYGIKTYVYGGTSGKPFQPTSFEGGSVLTFDLVLDATAKIPFYSKVTAPSPYPTGFGLPVSGQVLFWESYSGGASQELPDEWIDAPADEYIAVSDSVEVVEVWKAVAAKMPTSKLTVPVTQQQPKGKNNGAGSVNVMGASIMAGVVSLIAATAFMF
ncbi:hypothetical protein HDU97_009117 [Phlyctochytrium planicorne]|nr:hypothetical protein HDU97_009117 [Phlyctochytrium planicorne]